MVWPGYPKAGQRCPPANSRRTVEARQFTPLRFS
jgi:hypothetical protein